MFASEIKKRRIAGVKFSRWGWYLDDDTARQVCLHDREGVREDQRCAALFVAGS